ncbi:hypothetical protein A2U01_0039020, partial [Trifolium medium]|nr:hypothetical protein [Trifolium medium]
MHGCKCVLSNRPGALMPTE